jgi:aspartate 1-decarboxylase
MPNATYLLIGDQTPQQVYTLGAAAANAIGGKARIIVAGSSFSQMWLGGLDPV